MGRVWASCASTQLAVTVWKESSDTRVGIVLSPHHPRAPPRFHPPSAAAPAAPPSHSRCALACADHAIIHNIRAGSNAVAAGTLAPYDEIQSVGGVECESALHAVGLIRNAPAGKVELLVRQCAPAMVAAATAVQSFYRATGRCKRLFIYIAASLHGSLACTDRW